jgi:hypothetical protein
MAEEKQAEKEVFGILPNIQMTEIVRIQSK